MTKEIFINKNRIQVIVILAAGGVLLAYALFHSSSKSTIPGWEPVNASLEKAMATTNPSNPSNSTNPTNPSNPSNPSNPTNSTTAPQSHLTTNDNLLSGSTINNTTPAPSATIDPESISKEATAASMLLDLNQATQAQLETLPGIGPAKAQAIITYREQHNGFQSIEQLLKVKGIGPKMLARLSALVQVSPAQ
jgi:competence protein ComEA